MSALLFHQPQRPLYRLGSHMRTDTFWVVMASRRIPVVAPLHPCLPTNLEVSQCLYFNVCSTSWNLQGHEMFAARPVMSNEPVGDWQYVSTLND